MRPKTRGAELLKNGSVASRPSSITVPQVAYECQTREEPLAAARSVLLGNALAPASGVPTRFAWIITSGFPKEDQFGTCCRSRRWDTLPIFFADINYQSPLV